MSSSLEVASSVPLGRAGLGAEAEFLESPSFEPFLRTAGGRKPRKPGSPPGRPPAGVGAAAAGPAEPPRGPKPPGATSRPGAPPPAGWLSSAPGRNGARNAGPQSRRGIRGARLPPSPSNFGVALFFLCRGLRKDEESSPVFLEHWHSIQEELPGNLLHAAPIALN